MNPTCQGVISLMEGDILCGGLTLNGDGCNPTKRRLYFEAFERQLRSLSENFKQTVKIQIENLRIARS